MTKAIVLKRFHGSNFANVYEEGSIHDFEETRAQSLALKGLVRLLDVDAPGEDDKAETETSETETETPKPKRTYTRRK